MNKYWDKVYEDMALVHRVHWNLLQRANGKCEECGIESEFFEKHHIKSQAQGGEFTLDNLKLLCKPCHVATSSYGVKKKNQIRETQLYSREEKLVLTKQIAVTQKVHDLLVAESKKQKISMAKIVCNLVLENYEKDNQ